MASVPELTIVFYTANVIPEHFAEAVRGQLAMVVDGLPIVSVSHKPIDFGKNIIVNLPRHHLSIYRQALIGAKVAKTKYIALCEDDVLYSPEHFKHRPQPGKFAYNLGHWGVYTWQFEPIFSWKGRRNMHSLICERELFIEAMEERFARYPDYDDVDLSIWSEPGKYERQLGVTQRETETFWTNPPNVVFSHENALAYNNLGTRKKIGELRAYDVPYWGHVKDIKEIYR